MSRMGLAYRARATATNRLLPPNFQTAPHTEVYGIFDVRLDEDGELIELLVQYEGIWGGEPFTDADGVTFPGRQLLGISHLSQQCELESKIWLATSQFTEIKLYPKGDLDGQG